MDSLIKLTRTVLILMLIWANKKMNVPCKGLLLALMLLNTSSYLTWCEHVKNIMTL